MSRLDSYGIGSKIRLNGPCPFMQTQKSFHEQTKERPQWLTWFLVASLNTGSLFLSYIEYNTLNRNTTNKRSYLGTIH